ncbi:MAG: hypothetical protein II930_09380 [Lachnospiraceae bacterium]|nr:hypothetical protein [Lachnospiraceae bacterium]
MKKIRNLIFAALFLLICLTPLLGMPLYHASENTENRTLASFPGLTGKDRGVNLKFFEEFEAYFKDHFALRQELVCADAKIQGGLFRVSAADNVVYGKDGWLFYRTTLGDYQGTNRMSEREMYALKENLEIVLGYLHERGIGLAVAVPPNKNTLYPEGMPYYDSMKVSEDHTLYHLPALMGEAGIPYADLCGAFRAEDEVLYLKRDSHWNQKGAMLAFRTIWDSFAFSRPAYGADESVLPTRNKDTVGDLSRMLYTVYGEKEWNYTYDIAPRYTYVTPTKSVEDAWIETEAEGTGGRFLCFRDSFGNTLLPHLANQFGHAYFTKEAPYRLDRLVKECTPDLVLFEKVERNLRDFITVPPILPAPEIEKPEITEIRMVACELKASYNLFDPTFLQVSGTLPKGEVRDDTRICLEAGGRCYQAYLTGENGFMLYLDWEELNLPEEGIQVRILSESADGCRLSAEMILREGETER